MRRNLSNAAIFSTIQHFPRFRNSFTIESALMGTLVLEKATIILKF